MRRFKRKLTIKYKIFVLNAILVFTTSIVAYILGEEFISGACLVGTGLALVAIHTVEPEDKYK